MSAIDDPIRAEAQEIPYVRSPYEGRQITTSEHLRISAYWFATNFVWGPLLAFMIQADFRKLVPYEPVTALGLALALGSVIAILAPLVIGALSDRCASKMGRRRPYIIFGATINVVGLILMAIALAVASPVGRVPHGTHAYQFLLANPTFDFFVGSYLIVQIGNNIAAAAFSGVIPDLVPHEQRGKASGYMALMTQIGTVLGMILIGLILGHQSDFIKYGAICVVYVITALVTVLGIQETPLPIRPAKIDWAHYVKSLWISPKLYPDFAWVWITRALVMLGFYAVLPFLPYYLGDVVKVENPTGFMTYLGAAILTVAAISGIVGGVLSDKVGRKRIVYWGNGIIAIVSVAFIFCTTKSAVLIAAAFFGLGYGAYISVDWALGSDVLPSKKDAAKEMGVWHIAMTFPQTIAAPLTAILIEHYGKSEQVVKGETIVHYTQQGYAAMFVLCSVCFALGAVLIKNVRSVE